MPMHNGTSPRFTIEKMDESWGHCNCCGRDSHSVTGFVYDQGDATAAYRMRWTKEHLSDTGANFDLVLGQWGEGTTPADRYVIAMIHRQQPDGSPALMVVDAHGRASANAGLASTALRREDVIGTPLAAQVFALTDAIYEQDERFF